MDCLEIIFSKITWPFPQKSHECAIKLTDLRNASLLFDLNHTFDLIGASLLALAKSIGREEASFDKLQRRVLCSLSSLTQCLIVILVNLLWSTVFPNIENVM